MPDPADAHDHADAADATGPTGPADTAAALAVLERAAARVRPSPDLEDRVTAGLAHHHRRETRHRALAVAAALLVVVGTVIVLARPGGHPDPVLTGPSSEPTPSTAEGDTPVAAAPDPTELHDARWTELDPPPLLDDREGVTWASSDRYLLVWGGSVDRSADPPLGDGAVFDVRTGAWRRLGPFPGVAGRAGAGAVVDGDVAWVVGGRLGPSDGADGGDGGYLSGEVVRIDLATGTAEVVADSVRAARTYPVVAVADDRLVVAGGRRGDAYDRGTSVLDVAAGSWSGGDDLPWDTVADEFFGFPGTAIAAPDGDGVLLGRYTEEGDGPRFDLARLDAATASVTDGGSTPVGPAGLLGPEMRVLPTGSGPVVAQEAFGTRLVGVGPDGGPPRWEADVPVNACEGPMDAAVAAGTVVVRSLCRGIVGVDPASGDWVELPDPPTEVGRLVAVGDVLLYVDLGSPADAPDGEGAYPAITAALTAAPPGPPEPVAAPTSPIDLDGASTGRWQEVATAPLALGRREAEAVATSDRYLLTWGGRSESEPGPRADGAVLDLGTGEWRRIEAAEGVAGRWAATAVIDGDVAWVVGGSTATTDDGRPAIGEVVRIDLATGATEVVATDERAARLEPAVAVHGGEVIVAGGRVEGADALGVAALDPGTGTWRDGPDLPWGTASDDDTARLTDTAIAGAGTDDLVIARKAGEPDAPHVEVAWLDLVDLTTSAPALVRMGPSPAEVDEVAVIGGERTIVLYDRNGIQATGFDDGVLRWSGSLPLGSCEGPVAGQATSGVAYVGVCGQSTFVDPVDGRTAPVPDPPPSDWAITIAGDRVLALASGPGGEATAWVLVAG